MMWSVLTYSWFSFSVRQPPRDPDPSGPEGIISVAISSHYFFGEDQRTPQLEEILRRFPTWAFPSSWVSTYDMYRYWGSAHATEADAEESWGLQGPPRQTDRQKRFSRDNTEKRPCCLFTLTQTRTTTHTHSHTLPPSLPERPPSLCQDSRLSS